MPIAIERNGDLRIVISNIAERRYPMLILAREPLEEPLPTLSSGIVPMTTFGPILLSQTIYPPLEPTPTLTRWERLLVKGPFDDIEDL